MKKPTTIFDNLLAQGSLVPDQKKLKSGKIGTGAGRPAQKDKHKYLVTLPIELHNKLVAKKKEVGIDVSVLITMTLCKYLDKMYDSLPK